MAQLFETRLEGLRDEDAEDRADVGVPHVREVMRQPVHLCSRSVTAADALRRMKEHDVGFLPLVDEDQRVVGVVTARDLAVAILERHLLPESIALTDVVTRPAVTVGPRDTVLEARALMELHQVHRLPVVDDQGHPMGLVSAVELARTPTPPVDEQAHVIGPPG